MSCIYISSIVTMVDLLCQHAEHAQLTGDWQQIKAWWSIHDLTVHPSNHQQPVGQQVTEGSMRKIKTSLIKSWDRKVRERQTAGERQQKYWKDDSHCRRNLMICVSEFSTELEPFHQNPRCICSSELKKCYRATVGCLGLKGGFHFIY